MTLEENCFYESTIFQNSEISNQNAIQKKNFDVLRFAFFIYQFYFYFGILEDR